MAIDNIPQPGCVLENVEMRDDNELPGDAVAEFRENCRACS